MLPSQDVGNTCPTTAGKLIIQLRKWNTHVAKMWHLWVLEHRGHFNILSSKLMIFYQVCIKRIRLCFYFLDLKLLHIALVFKLL